MLGFLQSPQRKNKTEMEATRNIRVYSNPINEKLDYTKTYVFHHWISKRTALIEELSTGYLMEVAYEGNFNFKVDKLV